MLFSTKEEDQRFIEAFESIARSLTVLSDDTSSRHKVSEEIQKSRDELELLQHEEMMAELAERKANRIKKENTQ